MRRILSALLVLFASIAARADQQPIDAAKGRFTFKYSGAKCYALEGKALSKLAKAAYTCDMTEQQAGNSDGMFVECAGANKGRSVMVFKTKKACQTESDAQTANAD